MLRFRWITFDRFKVVNLSRFYRVNFIRPYWVNFTVFSKKIADAYAKVAYTADKALGGKRYDESRKQLENLAEQQILIQKQINEEQSKKKTDHGKIEEWQRQILEEDRS